MKLVNGCCEECPGWAAKPRAPVLCDDCIRRRDICAKEHGKVDTKTRETINKSITQGQQLSDEVLIKIGRKAVEFVMADRRRIAADNKGLDSIIKIKDRPSTEVDPEELLAALQQAMRASDALEDAKRKLGELRGVVEALID